MNSILAGMSVLDALSCAWGTVLWSRYVMGMALAGMMGIIYKKTIFKSDAPMFIIELPPCLIPKVLTLFPGMDHIF